MLNQDRRKIIAIRSEHLSLFAYIYICCPIIVFFLGWLKLWLGILFSIALILGLWFVYRDSKKNTVVIEIPFSVLLLTVLFAAFWVLVAGIGGMYPQQADWNWRNAILRDLIDYSWPVVYPETNCGLVYYLSYFLVPALVGKLVNWEAANIALYIWTVFGIIIVFLLLYQYFKIKSFWKFAFILLLFAVWREFDGVGRKLGADFSYYEFTNNNALLQWVTNQTVVPWIATLLFLNNRRIENYAFLGLCVLPSAPFPLVGLFVLLAGDGIYQLVIHKYENVSTWIKSVLSPQNILSILSILIVFAIYFSGNLAATGGGGKGGIHLNVSMTKNGIWSLLLFWLFNSLAFPLLIFREYKKDFLFYLVLGSVLIFPLIRIGDGRDFCMRAPIPAICVIMVYTGKYVLKQGKSGILNRCLIIGAICIFTFSFGSDVIKRTSTVIHAESREQYQADAVTTLSNKLPYTQAYGSYMNMYLTDNPESLFFWRYLAKGKSEKEYKQDVQKTDAFLNNNGFSLVSGEYELYWEKDGRQFPIQTVVLSNTTIPSKYEIYIPDSEKRVAVDIKDDKRAVVFAGHDTEWATNETDNHQLFEIIEKDGKYRIIWDEKYALIMSDELSLSDLDENKEQYWKIVKKGS